MIYIAIGIIILIVSFIIALLSLIREQKKVSNEVANQAVSPIRPDNPTVTSPYNAFSQPLIRQQPSINNVPTPTVSPVSSEFSRVGEGQPQTQAGLQQPQASAQFPWDKQQGMSTVTPASTPEQEEARKISGVIVPRDISEEQ